MTKTKCESCIHYVYDNESFTAYCEIDLDEDEFERFVNGRYKECPYYDDSDEYKTVRKQM